MISGNGATGASPRKTAVSAAAALCLLVGLGVARPTAAADWVYSVQPGDNPWNLTERFLAGLKYWPRIQTLNQITDPRHIPPGTRLRIPVAWLRPAPATAQVVGVQGRAEAITTGTRRALSNGMRLVSGTILTTETNSNVTIEFEDGSRMLVHADSELHLQELRSFENTGMVATQVNLVRGRSENLVQRAIGAGSRFEITTPAAVTAVRGTEFRVAADPAQTRSEVLDGLLQVGTGGSGVAVGAGFGTVANAGRAPDPPVPLLPAPDLSALPARLERVPLALSLPTVAGATGYRVQIAATTKFLPLLYDAATGSAWRGPDLPDGRYVLRIRAVDQQDLEGLSAEHPFELNARPEPPLLTLPAPDASVLETEPEFQWATRPGLDQYRMQLARTSDFSSPLMDATFSAAAPVRAATALEPGIYYWRVAAIDATDGPGPFSDTQQFRRPPPGPALEAPAIDENQLTVRWRAGLAGQRYRFQLASEDQFAAPLVDAETEDAEFTFPRPAGGKYFMRVQTIDVDGFVGPYGATQSIDVPGEKRPWWLLLAAPLLLLLL